MSSNTINSNECSNQMPIDEFTKLLDEFEIYKLIRHLGYTTLYKPGYRKVKEGMLRGMLKKDCCQDGENITLDEFNKYCREAIESKDTINKIEHAFGVKSEPEFCYPVKHIDELSTSPFQTKINTIKATIEKQLRKLRELQEQEKE